MAKKELNAKQHKALALLVAGMSQEAAATGAGVRKETLGQWLRDNKFSDELRLALERMRQTFEARVMGLANNAAVVVGDMISDDKDKERQLEGAKLAFNAAVRLSNRYKELQVEGYVAPAQPLVVFPTGTRFPWQNRITQPLQPLEIPDVIDVEAEEVVEKQEEL
jgi:DNA-binding XRE family transcriptional regulator